MKKLIYLLPILIMTIALTSCKTTEEAVDLKETVSEAPSDGTDIANNETPVATDNTEDRELFASIERTFCFGNCPVYKMKIYESGQIEFDGTRHVDIIGKYTTDISESQMNALLEKANSIEFFEMEDTYDDEMVTDLPSTTISVLDEDGNLKTVMFRYNFPKRLNGLAEMFDNLIKSERWVSETGEIYPPER